MNNHAPESNRKLSQQLLTSFGASLMVIGLSTLAIAYTSLQHRLEQQIQQRAESITRGLEFASEGLIETQDLFLLERLVQNYGTLPAVIEVSIVDPDGFLLAHSNTFELNTITTHRYRDLHPTIFPAFQQASQQGRETNVRMVLDEQFVVVHILPFSSSLFNQLGYTSPSLKQSRGVVIAIMDLQAMEQEAWQNALSSILAMMGSAVLILIFMGWLIRKLVLFPLEQINLSIAQSEHQGNFTIPALPNNEIGFLGTTFAAVYDQLKTYKQMELEIVERKYAEIAKCYELATRAAKVWVWDWQIETDIFLLDRGIQEWLGYIDLEFPDQFSGWAKYIHADDRDLFLQAFQNHLNGKTSEFSCEHRLLKSDGTYHWFLSRGQAVQDEYGNVIRAIGTITDIAERKQSEAQLQQTNHELARATRLKDEFLATMSHELRTPLNAILGMTEALQEEVFGTLNSKQVKALQTVERSGSHLLALINDILDVAKIEAGQIELDYAPTPISLLCQSSLAFVKQQAFQKRIQLEVQLQPDLPDLLVDERRIRQVLINLLNNAVKFTPAGGRVILEVGKQEEEGGEAVEGEMERWGDFLDAVSWIRFSVIDTGIGIAAEDINKLFKPFIQIDSTLNRQYAGTGLGLALVKQIVEMHGGHVGVTSEVGVGSCFTIALPHNSLTCLRPESVTATQSPHSTLTANETVARSPLILLAEDNAANISTVSSYLQAKGYRILLAGNGQEAIDQAISQTPDLILMDIQMPGVSGLEAIYQIRADPQVASIPIIALTALAMSGDRQKCLDAGATEYLTKPVHLKELSQLIQALLAS